MKIYFVKFKLVDGLKAHNLLASTILIIEQIMIGVHKDLIDVLDMGNS